MVIFSFQYLMIDSKTHIWAYGIRHILFYSVYTFFTTQFSQSPLKRIFKMYIRPFCGTYTHKPEKNVFFLTSLFHLVCAYVNILCKIFLEILVLTTWKCRRFQILIRSWFRSISGKRFSVTQLSNKTNVRNLSSFCRIIFNMVWSMHWQIFIIHYNGMSYNYNSNLSLKEMQKCSH